MSPARILRVGAFDYFVVAVNLCLVWQCSLSHLRALGRVRSGHRSPCRSAKLKETTRKTFMPQPVDRHHRGSRRSAGSRLTNYQSLVPELSPSAAAVDRRCMWGPPSTGSSITSGE